MNYTDPQLRELLAAEYALGTLTGAARRRFEQLLVDDARLRAKLVEWETHFATWGSGLPRQVPHARVWRRIKRELSPRRSRQSLWSSVGLYQTCAGLATLALIAVVAWWQLAPLPTVTLQTAIVTSQTGDLVWVVSAQRTTNELTIDAVRATEPPAGKDYELWILRSDDQPPMSLGVLPSSGRSMRQLTATQLSALADSERLAVSIEPAGGSPTGAPTGPVVYTAPIAKS